MSCILHYNWKVSLSLSMSHTSFCSSQPHLATPPLVNVSAHVSQSGPAASLTSKAPLMFACALSALTFIFLLYLKDPIPM